MSPNGSSDPFSIENGQDTDRLNTALAELYKRTRKPLDDLAYTHDFSRIRDSINDMFGKQYSESELFRRLLRLRKTGLLPRLRDYGVSSSQSTDRRLDDLYESTWFPADRVEAAAVSAFSKKSIPLDSLAYTPDFDEIVTLINEEVNDLPENLRNIDVFRLLLRLRKSNRLPRVGRPSTES